MPRGFLGDPVASLPRNSSALTPKSLFLSVPLVARVRGDLSGHGVPAECSSVAWAAGGLDGVNEQEGQESNTLFIQPGCAQPSWSTAGRMVGRATDTGVDMCSSRHHHTGQSTYLSFTVAVLQN